MTPDTGLPPRNVTESPPAEFVEPAPLPPRKVRKQEINVRTVEWTGFPAREGEGE